MVPDRAVQRISTHTCQPSARVMWAKNGVTTAISTVDTAIWVTARVDGGTFGAKKPVVMMCSA